MGKLEREIVRRVGRYLRKLGKPWPALSGQEVDFLVSQYEDHTEQGRHSETERSVLTTFVIATQAAVFTYLGTKEFDCRFRLLALIIPVLSVYGACMCWILYLRFRRHSLFALGFRYLLERRLPNSGASRARVIVKNTYPKRYNLHMNWIILHVVVGAVSVIVIWAYMMGCTPISAPKQPVAEGQGVSTQSGPVNLKIENNPSITVQMPSGVGNRTGKLVGNTHAKCECAK